MRLVRLLLWIVIIVGVRAASYGNAGSESSLRVLLQDPRNQELIGRLGTRYEIVNPIQLSLGKGLSTRSTQDPALHAQNTSLLIDMRGRRLNVELQLNTDLFPSTLVQYLYYDEDSPDVIQELPEHCYYHGTVTNYPKATAAFHTCNGVRGIILLENSTFLIYPLHGNHSGNHPHLLYHFTTDQLFHCSNVVEVEYKLEKILQSAAELNVLQWNKYIELGLVLDQTLFEKYNLPYKEIISSALEIINYVDMIYRPLKTYVSLVFIEIWAKDRVQLRSSVSNLLDSFESYAKGRINMESRDALFLLTGQSIDSDGLANADKICTNDALGVAKTADAFRPHMTAHSVAHLLGHIIGMNHNKKVCNCPDDPKYTMSNDIPYLNFTMFSKSSIAEYSRTLSSGHGACLFNMPSMRRSVCGNRIVEAPEECDCGPQEECRKWKHCCDPKTCQFVKHAECSDGSCCKNCKILSADHLCRPSKGECDISEFCNGTDAKCPQDLFKRNGAICSGGEGYCYQGTCPVLKNHCHDIWGGDADVSSTVCFEKLNIKGTPNGHCGSLRKCDIEHSRCGLLHCNGGETTPVGPPPHNFMIYKESAFECKALTYNASDPKQGLVQDGTKCGFQKLCLRQSCTSVSKIASGPCPVGERQAVCSGRGTCTHIGLCSCDEGWRGRDCSDPDDGPSLAPAADGETELKLDPNLAFTVLAASIVIGLVFVIIVALFIFSRNLRSQKSSSNSSKEECSDVVKIQQMF